MVNKVTVIGLCTVFLVAAAVAMVIGVTHIKGKDEKSSGHKISGSNKAVQSLCKPTQYPETCEESLSTCNSTDPKDLIRTGFEAAMKELKDVLSKSETIKELNKDENTKAAMRVCQEVLDYAIDDIKRSFDQLGEYDISKISDIVMNLRVWLSGSVTSQQTCIDSFEEVDTESAEKMTSILKRSQELTSNALTMVSKLATILKDLKIPGLENIDTTGFERKLLWENDTDFPEWMSFNDRKLLQAKPIEIQPNLVVAQDGSGGFDTINKALAEVPKNSKVRFVIHIKAGTYREQILLKKQYINIMFLGDGPTKTIITGDLSVALSNPVKTFQTATVGVSGFFFMAKGITFENTAGPEGHQAVAMRATSDLAAFYDCHFSGYQDTLYAHSHRQFYRDCEISGTVDFIFGDSKTIFQNCKIIVKKPMEKQYNMVTAHGKKLADEDTGFVLQNCTISGARDYIPVKDKMKTYLGRPWKMYATTVVIQSQIDDIVTAEGWTPMNGTVGLDTCYYAEYNNRGPGADTSGRVTWPGIKKINDVEAMTFTAGPYLKSDEWLPNYGIPYTQGMIHDL